MENKNNRPNCNIYGRGNSAIGLTYIEHFRDEELKGHKINCTWTDDMFKTKESIYIEREELYLFYSFLLGYMEHVEIKRGEAVSGKNKSIILKRKNGLMYINADAQGSIKTGFKISNLERIVLKRIVEVTLLRQLKQQYGLTFTKEDLEAEVTRHNYLLKSESVEHNNIVNDEIVNNPIVVNKEVVGGNDDIELKFDNTYNNKTYTNKVIVSQETYNHIKNKDFLQMSESELKEVLNFVKSHCIGDSDKAKFLNLDTIKTLRK